MRGALSDEQLSLAARKTELRLSLRRMRVAIPGPQRRRSARQAARQLLHWRSLNRARDIAVYLSVRSELSTAPLIALLLRRGHRLWAPVTGAGQRMRFAPLRTHSCLRRGALGLPQVTHTRPLRSARSLDLILLPLLGFDARGRRLGNGGGYYDRALAAVRNVRRPLLVGYAYAAQEIAAVPAEPWDVRLDAAVTERGRRRFI
ncbi:MAG TPA: 5-formyltetrahydrofolate cyclo-ligase [Nevskia sp.]|nr:5-formyltetrahydrofolate cyclo-ligase [Nevskia sp.]